MLRRRFARGTNASQPRDADGNIHREQTPVQGVVDIYEELGNGPEYQSHDVWPKTGRRLHSPATTALPTMYSNYAGPSTSPRAVGTGTIPEVSQAIGLLWNNSAEKFFFPIPQTVLLNPNGSVQAWLFTSKDGQILKKTSNKTSINAIRRAFIDEATKDTTNMQRYICVTWKPDGSGYELLKSGDFTSFYDQLLQVEEGEQESLPPNSPNIMQAFIQPLSNTRYTSTYILNTNGEEVCQVTHQKYITKNLKDYMVPDSLLPSTVFSSPMVLSDVRKGTLYTIRYLRTVYGMIPNSMTIDFIQDTTGKLYLSNIISISFKMPEIHRYPSVNSVQAYGTEYGGGEGVTRPGSVSSQSPYVFKDSGRVSSTPDVGYVPHAPESERPRTAPQTPVNRGYTPSVYSMATFRRKPNQSSNRTGSNIVLQLTKEIDTCKSQIAGIYRDIATCKEGIKERGRLADEKEQEFERLSRELELVDTEKQELSATLKQIWSEAMAQAQELKKLDTLLQELDLKMTTLLHEKDSSARDLSDQIVVLKGKIEAQSSKLNILQGDRHEIKQKIEEVEGHIEELQEQKEAEMRRVEEMQTLLANRERELRLRLDRTDRIRADLLRREAARFKSGSNWSKGLLQTRKTQQGDDANEDGNMANSPFIHRSSIPSSAQGQDFKGLTIFEEPRSGISDVNANFGADDEA